LLVVDDEGTIRLRLQELGESLGFQVCAAQDGAEAWKIFSGDPPDLVILDLYMPRMNGLMLLSKIKQAQPRCPVILITGFLHEKALQFLSGARPDGCIFKPLNHTQTSEMMLKLVNARL
jgi:CheY-like chemotaxis protein